ncbi:hypothetical protein [Nocardioides sp.]|uniref:hypothetical protein n=1 Tax=Nocardioides sp. TaxID=35761 RepID=UPI002CE055A3|nr:hypothetical protein [Nocardioides sp.]HXH79518.1 hypothetical protein [Nocardioides sp.]
MAGSTIQNETIRSRVLAGVEPTIGAGGAVTFPLYGTFAGKKSRSLIRDPQFRGSYDGNYNPARGPETFDGYTYGDKLSFQDLAILPRIAVSKPPTAVSDANAVPGYTRAYRPSDAVFDSLVVQRGVVGMPFVTIGIQADEWTISHNGDDASGNWMWGSNLIVVDDDMIPLALAATAATGGTTTTIVKSLAAWTVDAYAGRYVAMRTGTAANIDQIVQILSNTADTLTLATALPAAVAAADTFEISGAFTAGVADRTLDYIQNPGTQLIIADDLAGLSVSSNVINDKMISFGVTQTNMLKSKRFSDNIGGVSKKRGRGMREVVWTIVMEFDDWKEYRLFELAYPKDRALRVQQLNGPVIDATAGSKQTAIITSPRVQWDDIDPQGEREGNITATYAAVAYVPAAGYVVELASKTKLATLP